METIIGPVWIFGDDIDTDAIVSGLYLDAPIEEAVPHVLENVRPDFPKGVRPGDLMVAGRNFGCGSSREQAAEALRSMGIGCIVAESFGRIFFRNAVAVGLPVLTCPGVSAAFGEQHTAVIDLARAGVENRQTGETMTGHPLSPEMIRIISAGGVLALLQNQKEGYK
ncbi:MAG: 3-isopropylmalate dehydratase small subunit [Desulfobacterales bacterium]|nr:3-isopropylmalate dehydratase small subunit [Desulfobacterales bacterium]